MLFPRTTANPTEIIGALTTGHVVTAATFFDTRATERAVFRIGRDIICSFRVIATLFEPRFYYRTIGGKVEF